MIWKLEGNLIEVERSTKDGMDTGQEMRILAVTFLSPLFPLLSDMRLAWPTASTKRCAICCSVTLPTWDGDLMEDGMCIKTVFILNFSALSNRWFVAMGWGRGGLVSCAEDGNKGDVVRVGFFFGFCFVPVSVYNICHFRTKPLICYLILAYL